jgi:RNA ligase
VEKVGAVELGGKNERVMLPRDGRARKCGWSSGVETPEGDAIYPNGINTSYTYDDLNRLKRLKADLGATPITDFQYVYDHAGNRTRKQQLDYTEDYSYDPLYRLTGVERSAGLTLLDPEGRLPPSTIMTTLTRPHAGCRLGDCSSARWRAFYATACDGVDRTLGWSVMTAVNEGSEDERESTRVEGFVKFPRTPHLVWLGKSSPRGDKLMAAADADEWLRQPMSVEEKIDGANLGLSLGADGRFRAQSRGHYLDPRAAGQWKPLWRWLAQREDRLRSVLAPWTIVFGEWCYAEHSVYYDALPDWFLLFDIYDRREGRFWSRIRRDEMGCAAGLSTVPLVATGVFRLPALRTLLGCSRIGSAPAEGVYLRWDDTAGWLRARAKIVRPDWIMAGDEHWSTGPLKANRLVRAGGSPHRG